MAALDAERFLTARGARSRDRRGRALGPGLQPTPRTSLGHVGEWIDLVDPDEAELERQFGKQLHPRAIERLLEPAKHEDEPRPTIERQGDYVFGVVLVAVAVPEEDRVFYQEIDIVLTHELVLTVRKTPPGEQPYDTSDVHAACNADGDDDRPGMVLYRLLDDIAERYLDLIDSMNDEIDDLEDHVEVWSRLLSASGSPGFVTTCCTCVVRSPPRATPSGGWWTAASAPKGRSSSRPSSALHFGDAYDKLLRASDGLELSRDLVSGVRDYSQAKIANDQNEIVKRLTAIASILLVPTFIVGIYGQNFEFPEMNWGSWATAWSWGLILVDHRVPDLVLPPQELAVGNRRRHAGRMPYFICPNCKERSIDHDGATSLLDPTAVGCSRCGFGFLFELMEDYYPAPTTGFVVCDQSGRILAVGRGVFELTGYTESELMGSQVVTALGLDGFEDGREPGGDGPRVGRAEARPGDRAARRVRGEETGDDRPVPRLRRGRRSARRPHSPLVDRPGI